MTDNANFIELMSMGNWNKSQFLPFNGTRVHTAQCHSYCSYWILGVLWPLWLLISFIARISVL